ncbi:MAG: hypothetical protein LBQ27_00955 [Clostridiales bacterium]|jgi:hypothetical protein|nr:hypothetical protein [Clostridiales bacterium]
MGKFNLETKVRDILDDKRAVAIIEEYAPGITSHPMVFMVKTLTLGQTFSYRDAVKSSINLTDGQIDEFIEKLLALK